jgi:hypothetical protein
VQVSAPLTGWSSTDFQTWDDKAIRAQSAISDKTPALSFVFTQNRAFWTDGFYPSGKHGWRA